MAGVRQLFYVSRAAAQVSKPDIDQLLASARRNNWRLDVTGCLMFSGRCFAQTLEGDAAHIEEVVARIASDPRHADMKILVDRVVSARQHASWSMGYVYNLDLADHIDSLLAGESPTPEDAVELMVKMTSDSVMGPL